MAIVTQQTGQFSGYTLDELRSLTLKRLRVTNTTRYSPTGGTSDYDWIDDALNRGQEEFVRKTRCLRTYALVEMKDGYRTYRLPWNFLDFMSAYFYDSTLADGYTELAVTTIEKLNDEVSDWRTKTGSPEQIYIDRIYGNNWMFGLYPTPDTNGDTITFDTNYGAIVQWVCPAYTFNSEYGVVLRMSDTDEYFLNTDSGVVGKVGTMDHNVWIEYYRLCEKLIDVETHLGTQGIQIPDIPIEYHKCLVDYAASDLLENNPEDSAEFKRSILLRQFFDKEADQYIKNRKRPVAGIELQTKPHVWSWMNNMSFYKGMP